LNKFILSYQLFYVQKKTFKNLNDIYIYEVYSPHQADNCNDSNKNTNS